MQTVFQYLTGRQLCSELEIAGNLKLSSVCGGGGAR